MKASASACGCWPRAPGASAASPAGDEAGIAQAAQGGGGHRPGQRVPAPPAGPAGAGRRPRPGSTGRPSPRTRFTVSVSDKLALLQLANEEMKKVKGVFSASGGDRPAGRAPASSPPSEGSLLEQHIYQIAPEITATAVDKGRKTKTRTYRPARGLRRLRGGHPRPAASRGPPGRRRSGQPPEGALGPPGQARPGAAAHPPRPHHPRIHRPLHRARPGAGLGGQLRRHLVPDHRQAGQVPGRGRPRQLPGRPHPPREPVHLRLGRRRRGHRRVPHHRQGDLRRLPDHPRPGPPGGRQRLHRLLLRRLVRLGAVPAHAQRLAGARRQAGDPERPHRRRRTTAC